MAEDKSEDSEPSPDSGRAKRAPPTIDLEATEISGDTQNAGAGAEPKRFASSYATAAAILALHEQSAREKDPARRERIAAAVNRGAYSFGMISTT